MAEKKKEPVVVVKKTIPGYMNFVIGGTSGMMAICIVHPADLVKTRMQLLGPAGKNASTLGVASGIVKNEGVMGLYRGLSAGVLRQATYTTARLGCFNGASDFYKNWAGGVPPSFPMKLLLGTMSGGVGAFFGTPADVALIRMTADGRLPKEKRRNYKNVFNALGRMMREEGLTSLWRGGTATISRAMVVNAAQLGTYSQAREMLLPAMGDGLHLHTFASMISGLVTTAASLPVDIVKTRIQNSSKRMGQVQVLSNILKNEGVLALWSGFLPTLGKLGPITVFIFVFMEQLNALYLRMA